LPASEAIGKNISYMQPSYIAKTHDLTLKNFIDRKTNIYEVIEFPLLVGVDKEGFALAYNVKI